MIRILVKTTYFILLGVILLAGIIISLISTEPGLQTLVQISQLYLPGKLSVHQVKGTLFQDFILNEVVYEEKTFKLKINQIKVQWRLGSGWREHFLAAQWQDLRGELDTGKTFSSLEGNLNAVATLPHLKLKVNSKLDTSPFEHWQLETLLHGEYPWRWNMEGTLSQTEVSKEIQPGFHANLSLRGYSVSKNQGNLALSVHPGYYNPAGVAYLPVLYFQGGTIYAKLSQERLAANGVLALDQGKNLNLELQLPQFALDKGFQENQRIQGDIKLEVNSLDFLERLSPAINKLKGQLAVLFKINGTLGNPQVDSQLLVNQTSFSLPKIGLDLNSLNLKIHTKAKKWMVSGSVQSDGRNLSLHGEGTLQPGYYGDLLIEGTNFPVIKTSEYQINASPQLKVHFTANSCDISGTILIPEAQIKPQTFSNSVTLPDEVLYKKHQEQPVSPPTMNANLNVNIEMGANVALAIKGLKGHIDGVLNVKQQAQGSMNAFGELSVRDGTYKAYGQELGIQQGELIFTGGPITSPGISLRAAKKVNNTSSYTSATQLFDLNNNELQNTSLGDSITLGVEVSGRLTSPKVQLFSDPAIFSQADILSMLVLGRPANQANKAGGQLLLAAISSMNVAGTNSTQLLEQLKQSSGLDFNVQTNTNYNQMTNTVSDSTAFVVGKSLSKRLYLSYNIGLSQTDANVLTLKYLLNKFFSIQVNTSTNSSGIDFLYTSHKKK